jgi:hypothetical protein
VIRRKAGFGLASMRRQAARTSRGESAGRIMRTESPELAAAASDERRVKSWTGGVCEDSSE